jgi:hypothetical protein
LKTYLKTTRNLIYRMNIQDRLIELIDEDLNQRLNLIMNDYVTIISKKHGIPMELLLRDVPTTSSISLCRGIKSNGQRCTRKGANNGYCGHHAHQGERIKQRLLPSSNIHTHGPEKMFVKGCPGCQSPNELIDLNSILNNEQI